MLHSLSSLFKSSSTLELDSISNQPSQKFFEKILATWQEKCPEFNSELSLSCPLIKQDSALKDHILTDDMKERKTFIFGFEREDESIVGPGIISIPLLSSISNWAVMATCYGIKIFQLELMKSDPLMRVLEAIFQYLNSVKDSLVIEKILSLNDISQESLGKYAEQIHCLISEIPDDMQKDCLSRLAQVQDYYNAFLQKQTIIDVVIPNGFEKNLLEWDIFKRILEKPVSVLWTPPPRTSSIFLKEEDLIINFGTNKAYGSTVIKYEYDHQKYQTIDPDKLSVIQKQMQTGRIQEILDTEKKFIMFLKFLDTNYNSKILKDGESHGLPSTSFVNSLVVQVGNLIAAHEKFLSDCQTEFNVMNIADSFTNNCHELESALNQYCIEQVQSDLHINRNPSKAFKLFLQRLENELINENPQISIDLSFQSLRGQPIQRVTRYSILFKDLLEVIDPKDMEVYAAVNQAYKKARALAENVNVAQREGYAQKIIFQTTLASKFKIPIRGNSVFVADIKISEICKNSPVSKWIILFSTYLVVLSGNPKSFEYDIMLEKLELRQFDENEFSLYNPKWIDVEKKFLVTDTPERSKAFLKHLRHHILMQTHLKDCESKVYAEHYGQHDYYYRVVEKGSFIQNFNIKNCGDVLMIVLEENYNIDDILDLNHLKYNSICFVQILPNSFNYSFKIMENQMLSSQDNKSKLRLKEFKSDLLLALKNTTTLKLLNGRHYSERDRKLLKGTLQSLAQQIFEFMNMICNKQKNKSHNRIHTQSSVASSKIAASINSVKSSIVKAFSMKRRNEMPMHNGSPAVSTTSIHNLTPDRLNRKRTMTFQNIFIKQNRSLETLQNNYTELSTKIVDQLLSRKSDIESNQNKKEIIKALLEGKCPDLSYYSTQTCLEALKEYTLSLSKLFFDDKIKSMILHATKSTDLDSEIIPIIENILRRYLDQTRKERFSNFLQNLKRLSQISTASWWPEKEISLFFYPIFKVSQNNLTAKFNLGDRSNNAEQMKKLLDCLIFHHYSFEDGPNTFQEKTDNSSIVGENFLISSFVEATKVSLQDFVQGVISEDLLHVKYQESTFLNLEPPYEEDEMEDFAINFKDVAESCSKSLQDPFLLIPFVINVIDSSNSLKESLTFYQHDNIMERQLPQKFIEIAKQPLFTDETIANIEKEIEMMSNINEHPVKPKLIDVDEAEKTFASFRELGLGLDLGID